MKPVIIALACCVNAAFAIPQAVDVTNKYTLYASSTTYTTTTTHGYGGVPMTNTLTIRKGVDPTSTSTTIVHYSEGIVTSTPAAIERRRRWSRV